MTDGLPEIERIQAYTPKPGDVLFVRLPDGTPMQTCKQAKDQLERNIPGVIVVVLTGEIEIDLPASDAETELTGKNLGDSGVAQSGGVSDGPQ